MIIGAHTIIFSTNPEADRAFLRDVLHLSYVDSGDGWLIFKSPPAEIAVHPYKRNNVHTLYLMCDDIQAFMAEMKQLNVSMRRRDGGGVGFVDQYLAAGRRKTWRLPAATRQTNRSAST